MIFLPQDQTQQPDTERPVWVWLIDVAGAVALILYGIAAFIAADMLSHKPDHIQQSPTITTENQP